MIRVELMGGLGNQMFQYAALRGMMLDKKDPNGVFCIKKLTGETHNNFSLDHFNICEDIKMVNENCSRLGKILLNVYERRYFHPGRRFISFMNYITNIFGLYFIPDGYLRFKYAGKKNIKMVGYFQCVKYFDKHSSVIKKELRVKHPVERKNVQLLKKISNCNSVCLHIRMGDFIGSVHQVCDLNYYLNAMNFIKSKVDNPMFFVFSDNISEAKKYIPNDDNVVFVDKNNVNYEELRLMYSCKHFIMSNSSFSFWAQYLSENDKKVVVAPKRWYNEDIICDIYQDFWEIM